MNKNKSHAALNYFRDNNIQLACLSETWFQDENNYQTALFSDSGSFTSYNRPRKTDTIGGGVCIFIKNFYKSIHQKKTSYSAFECVSTLCCISNLPSQKLRIIAIYRREKVTFSIFIDEFSKFVQDLTLSKYPFIIGGDYNIHMNDPEHSYTRRFKRMCSSHNLNLSNVPSSKTHKDGNTIDFLVSDDNASCLITDCSVDYDAPNISHHFPVIYTVKTTLQCRSVAIKKPKRRFLHFDIDHFKADLSKSLEDNMYLCHSFEDKFNMFQEKLQICYDMHAPLHLTSIRHNERPKWMDQEYVQERAIRRRLEKQYRQTNTIQDEINWKLQRTKCSLLAAEKRDYMFTQAFITATGDT